MQKSVRGWIEFFSPVIKSNIFGKLSTILVFGGVFVISVFGNSLGETGTTLICLIITLYFAFYFGAYCADTLAKRHKSKTNIQ